tara:strand:- start:1169 stop:1690 length:522 start_codon:yes stop_codon:yes gene_type:complete
MKKYFFIFIFFLILSLQNKAFSYDCKLDKIKIDSSYESMELSLMFMVFNRHEDGTPALVAGPIESFCEDSNETNGAMVQLFFIENKLARIIFETSTTNNRVLFKIANNFYKVGFRQEQIKIEKKENETYTVNKEDNLYFYGNYKKEKEFLEYFEITGHKYGEKINQLLLKQEN